MNLNKLRDPLPPDAVEWRISRSGSNSNGVWATAVAYKTSRADMDRLDEVCGPENWQDDYKAGPSGGNMCGISIKVGDEWVTKWDGAENTNFDGVKGGLSDAFKRAAVKWGIGRYLYQLEEAFVKTSTKKIDGWNYQSANTKTGVPAFYWQPPQLPKWALPNTTHQANRADTPQVEDVGQPAPQANKKSKQDWTVYDAIVEAGLSENEFAAKNALKKCSTGYDTDEKAIAWMRKYRAARDDGTGKDSQAAADIANGK